MPTWGRFVCHVHCLVHDGAVRSSPCRPHHENFGRNLYHMFVPAYSASQSFVFVLSCGIRVASMSSVDSIPFKWCSHVSMGVLILLIIEIVMSILSNRCASLQVDPIIFNIHKINSNFSSTVSIPSAPSCLWFSRPPTLFLQGLRFLNHVSFYMWEVSSFFSFNVLIRWFPMKMLNSFKFINLHCCFFSGGSNSSFWYSSHSFPHS